MEHKMVSEKRGYKVLNVDQAKIIAVQNLEVKEEEISFGLPEINDQLD